MGKLEYDIPIAIERIIRNNNKMIDIINKNNIDYDEFRKDYSELRKIIIDENQAANLQDQINKNSSQLETIENVINPDDSYEIIIQKLTTKSNVISFSNGDYVLDSGELITLNYPIKIKGNNSTIKLYNGTQIKLNSSNINIVDLNFSVSNSTNLKGGESCLKIYKDNISINNCSFDGNMYYYGIFIGADEQKNCNDISITNSSFNNLGYGILKNGGIDLQANRLKLQHLKFTNILKGDAIELNVGKDVGYYIDDVYIENVTAGGIANAGIGIGIAGGAYGGDIYLQSRNGVLKNCIIKNCERESIHLEACNNFTIKDNTIENNLVSKGVAVYGSSEINICNNTIKNCTTGIIDDLGVVNSQFIISTNNNNIYNNRILNCNRGLHLGCSGNDKYSFANNNTFLKCNTGINVIGKCIILINNNSFYDCNIPFDFDYEHTSKSKVFATHNRNIELRNNTTIYEGNKVDKFTNVCNVSLYDNLIFDNNNFKLGNFSRSPQIFYTNEPLYFVKGDILYQDINSFLTQKIATTNGFRPLLNTTMYYLATAGNKYITCNSGGDPSKKYKKGHILRLTGLGESGADIMATITGFGIVDSKYLIYIDKTISNSTTGNPSIKLYEEVTFNV